MVSLIADTPGIGFRQRHGISLRKPIHKSSRFYPASYIIGINDSTGVKQPEHEANPSLSPGSEVYKAYVFARAPFIWLHDMAIRWPPRSPDLTSLHFYLWGYKEELMCQVCYVNQPYLYKKTIHWYRIILKGLPSHWTFERQTFRNAYITADCKVTPVKWYPQSEQICNSEYGSARNDHQYW